MKAQKTGFVFYGTHSNEVEYEYRGHKYFVEYPTGMSYWCTSPKVQHETEQKKIDRMIEDENKPKGEPIDWDEIFNMLDQE